MTRVSRVLKLKGPRQPLHALSSHASAPHTGQPTQPYPHHITDPPPVPSPTHLCQILVGGTAVWQRRDTVYGGNLSTEFKLPKKGGKGGKSDTLCSMNAQLNNKGNGQVRGGEAAAGVYMAAREVSWRRGSVAGAADCAGY